MHCLKGSKEMQRDAKRCGQSDLPMVTLRVVNQKPRVLFHSRPKWFLVSQVNIKDSILEIITRFMKIIMCIYNDELYIYYSHIASCRMK